MSQYWCIYYLLMWGSKPEVVSLLEEFTHA
jgi:hypothetical protein